MLCVCDCVYCVCAQGLLGPSGSEGGKGEKGNSGDVGNRGPGGRGGLLGFPVRIVLYSVLIVNKYAIKMHRNGKSYIVQCLKPCSQ